MNPDLIALHSSKAGIIGRVIGWSLRIPTVFTAHGWSFTEGVPKSKRFMYLCIEKIIGFFTDGIITVSKYDENLARKNKVLPGHKIQTIHNGVPEVKCPENVVRRGGKPIIIMVARFAVPKKQLELLMTLNKLRSVEWQVRFVGEGPRLQACVDYSKAHRLEDRVEFLGSRNDVKELLREADLFVLLSDWEGLPLSILEAMRSGLPIIASDVGGVREAVSHMVNGYLIPKGNEGELMQKLTHILSRPELRIQMGNKSRKLFEKKFVLSKMLHETVAYYEKIIISKEEMKV